MTLLWATPFFLQGVAIGVDEFVCHRRRTLPLWERVGHPLDSLLLAACLAIPLVVELEVAALRGWLVLAAVSCLFVSKDEFVHARFCTAVEHWLHALLFLLHPTVLFVAAFLWCCRAEHALVPAVESLLGVAAPGPRAAASLLLAQAAAVGLFCGYQALQGFRGATGARR